jgi:uncharacterized protein
MADFEWDEAKSHSTQRVRGFDFGYASRIFDGPTQERMDDRRDYGEIRVCAVGRVDENILIVAYTWRGESRRIISARPANRKERDGYRKIHG